MLADKMPLYQREMLVMEEKLHHICKDNRITDYYLDIPNPAYYNFLLSIIPVIENLAKDLHQALTASVQFPHLTSYKEQERFNYTTLKFLDKALNLAPKQIQIASNLVVLSPENRALYPFFNAYNLIIKSRTKDLTGYYRIKATIYLISFTLASHLQEQY